MGWPRPGKHDREAATALPRVKLNVITHQLSKMVIVFYPGANDRSAKLLYWGLDGASVCMCIGDRWGQTMGMKTPKRKKEPDRRRLVDIRPLAVDAESEAHLKANEVTNTAPPPAQHSASPASCDSVLTYRSDYPRRGQERPLDRQLSTLRLLRLRFSAHLLGQYLGTHLTHWHDLLSRSFGSL